MLRRPVLMSVWAWAIAGPLLGAAAVAARADEPGARQGAPESARRAGPASDCPPGGPARAARPPDCGIDVAQQGDGRGNDWRDNGARGGNGREMGHDNRDNGRDGRDGRDVRDPRPRDGRDGRGAGPDHAFRRGQRLPMRYRDRQYVVSDWRARQLSAPPRGYHWVRTGEDYVLVAIATGVILQLLLSQ